MYTKKVEMVIPPPAVHFVGDGFRVHNFIPSVSPLSMERMDPFILLDYNSPYHFPPSEQPKGVGVHPHRGFETVTIAYKGSVQHHDSSGGGGVIQEGDVQWMTAASGVLHKEYHEEEWSKKGGEFQMVQMWVNLPAKDKMSPPKYQSIENKAIPKVDIQQGKGEVEVIAGEYQSVKGAAFTFSPMHILNVKLQQDISTSFSFPASYNTALLLLEGEVQINQSAHASVNHMVLFENEGKDFEVKALKNSEFLILSGEPLNEPIAAHGPFVMNSREELMQAFEDFNQGKFGNLEE